MAIAAALVLPAKSTTPAVVSEFRRNPKELLLGHCRNIRDLSQIQAHVVKADFLRHPRIAENFLESAAIALPGNLDYALSVFAAIDRPNAAAYNIIIRAFNLNKRPREAILLFRRMILQGVCPDEYTFPCVVKSCARVRALKQGEQIHCLAVKFGHGLCEFVQNSLIHMYCACGEVELARHMFDEMPERSVVSWNSLLAGYSKCGDWEEVVSLFDEMRSACVAFDEMTIIHVLTACGRLAILELGEWISSYVEMNGLKKNRVLVTSLLDMYAKCGQMDSAQKLFDEMPQRDVVAWSAMISGYSQSNRCREALQVFKGMQMAGMEPNEVTMVSVLSSCAVLGALETGKWVHFFIKRKHLKLTVNLGTSLMEFYAKCGSIDNSLEVFHEMREKNVLSWTVLISGLATNGRGKEALEMFDRMRFGNVRPNNVTFIGVLSACSHAGMVEQGRKFFHMMITEYKIEPRIEHYGCMVDILSRAGLLEEAHQFIKNMPIQPNAIVWRTLLASCKHHKNVEIGEESLRQLVKLDPGHSGDYIHLSNIYASVNRCEDALQVRSMMRQRGIKKTPGCSLIEVDGVIHEFFAEDTANPLSRQIYEMIQTMIKRIKLAGYVPETVDARLEAEDDEKETSISHHSEKLAIAFGLIKTERGSTIRITKNLRVCVDCHSATKMISKVFGREIIVRDRTRFHHFRNGSCSCNDFW